VNLPLFRRRDLLKNLLRAPRDPLRLSPVLQARSDQILRDGAHARLEGVVGKRLVSIYEPGERSGAWIGGAFRLLDLGQLQYVLNKPNRFLFVMEGTAHRATLLDCRHLRDSVTDNLFVSAAVASRFDSYDHGKTVSS
jgi:hypothetical protein